MTAHGRDDVRALGEQLDRGVHLTFARFALVVPAFVLADALGSFLQLVPLRGAGGSLALLFAGMVCENRARVVVIASMHAGRRSPDWSQVLRHPAALAFAVVTMLDLLIPYLAMGVVAGLVFGLLRLPAIASVALPVTLISIVGFTLGLVLAAALLVALTLVALAGVVATIDTVVDGTAPHRAFGHWLRRTFRRRGLGTTLVAAAAVVMLFAGVPLLLSMIPQWAPVGVMIVIDAIPEGVADAVAMMFAWRWRDTVNDSRDGRDIELLLDAHDPPGSDRRMV